MMSKDTEEKEAAFKVVDRRRFTEEGEAINHDEKEEEKKQPKDLPKLSLADEKVERPAMSFSLFVQSLAHQAMMGLGVMPWPDSGLVRVDLSLAKETIDIMRILKEKTAGNLSKDEERLLENLVYQLKMAFVEIAKKQPSDGKTIIS